MKKILALHSSKILLFLSLVVSFPLFFENAFEHSSPMGYAGLFMQMAEQIVDTNFSLPLYSPYYGPGGIPFAYPPFGLYLLAFLIKVIGKYFIFLRFLPPLISLLSLIPLFYLVLELSDSPIAASIAVILVSTSDILYVSHAWAAGITRAPAFLFTLVSLYFYSRQMKNSTRTNLFFAGFFFGLALMSHLIYVLFCFIWIWWWAAFHNRSRLIIRLRNAFYVSLIGLLTASTWLITIFQRHGVYLVYNTLTSHGGEKIFSYWKNIFGLLQSFIQFIEPIASREILLFLTLLGLVTLLLNRRYVLVSFSFFILFAFPDNARFVYLLGAIFAAMGIDSLIYWVQRKTASLVISSLLLILIIFGVGTLWWDGYKIISKFSPNLTGNAFSLAEYIQTNTNSNEIYLALLRQDEAEWLPYLFQREPIVSQWGSEWLGEYNRQTYLMSLFRDC